MKGQITVYYDLPNLALYLERVGNKIKEEHVQDIIAEMLKQAVALHMNEEADTISGTLMEMFVSGDESRTTDGCGLGLSIDRCLTELQGGSFRLDIDGDLFKATVSFPEVE